MKYVFLDVSVLKGIFKRKVLCTMKNTNNTPTPNIPTKTPERESARLPETEPITLHSENPDYVSEAIKRIGPVLDKICQDNQWHIDALKDRSDPDYFPNPSSFSRIINNDTKRRIWAGQIFELRRVSGLSLDKLADGCEPFEYQQMTTQRLIEINEITVIRR